MCSFGRNSRKSIWRGEQLNMPHTTIHKILHKPLKFKQYKYQLLQNVTAQDKEVRLTLRTSIFLGGGRYNKDAVYVLPLANTLPQLFGMLRDAVSRATLDLQNTVKTPAGLLTVPILNICEKQVTKTSSHNLLKCLCIPVPSSS